MAEKLKALTQNEVSFSGTDSEECGLCDIPTSDLKKYGVDITLYPKAVQTEILVSGEFHYCHPLVCRFTTPEERQTILNKITNNGNHILPLDNEDF